MFLAEALIVVYAFLVGEGGVEAIQTMARLSGRVSLVLFLLIFLHYHRSDRVKNAFSVFAIAHAIHFLELMGYQFLKGTTAQLITLRVAGGALAYLLILGTPLLQWLESKGKVSSASVMRIEYAYLYYVWFVFLMTYVPRILGKTPGVGGDYYEFMIAFAFVLIAMMIRIMRQFRRAPVET